MRRPMSASRGRRSAHRADPLLAKETGGRTGSRPKPPEAGARSASLEPGRAPGYANLHSCSSGPSGHLPPRGKGTPLSARATGFKHRMRQRGHVGSPSSSAVPALLRFAAALRVTPPIRRGGRLSKSFGETAGPQGRSAHQSSWKPKGLIRAEGSSLAKRPAQAGHPGVDAEHGSGSGVETCERRGLQGEGSREAAGRGPAPRPWRRPTDFTPRSRCPKTIARSRAPPSRARRSRARNSRPSTTRNPCGSCRRRPFRGWSRP